MTILSSTRSDPVLGTGEFVALAASMMALLALSIDVMLPALATIGAELGAGSANRSQYVVFLLILGMSLGQLFYGPLSDSLGRKPSIVIGLALFGCGCVTSALADDFATMCAGRFLQGLGVAGPRIVTLALIRDQRSGADMARVMSLVIAVLMVGPLLGPFIGQGMLQLASWRMLFVALLVFDLGLVGWLCARQPETLPRTRRIPLSWRALSASAGEVFRSRVALGYALAAGLLFGALFAYVGSARQIYQDQYGVGAWFPFCFSLSGLAIAAASVVNARLLPRLGMRGLCRRAGIANSLLAFAFVIVAWACAGLPPLAATLGFVAAIFFCAGILFGNLNALAMEPLGHVAGVAAGVVGALGWFVAMVLATVIGQAFDGTVLPLAGGLLSIGVGLLYTMHWAETGHGRLVRTS